MAHLHETGMAAGRDKPCHLGGLLRCPGRTGKRALVDSFLLRVEHAATRVRHRVERGYWHYASGCGQRVRRRSGRGWHLARRYRMFLARPRQILVWQRLVGDRRLARHPLLQQSGVDGIVRLRAEMPIGRAAAAPGGRLAPPAEARCNIGSGAGRPEAPPRGRSDTGWRSAMFEGLLHGEDGSRTLRPPKSRGQLGAVGDHQAQANGTTFARGHSGLCSRSTARYPAIASPTPVIASSSARPSDSHPGTTGTSARYQPSVNVTKTSYRRCRLLCTALRYQRAGGNSRLAPRGVFLGVRDR